MLEELGAALATADIAAIGGLMADDVILRVAVHDQPFIGSEAATAILGLVLGGPLHDIEVSDVLSAVPAGSETEVGVLMFTASVPGYPERADGLLVVRPSADGRIGDLTVFLRPLQALGAMAAEVGKRLGGPPPSEL